MNRRLAAVFFLGIVPWTVAVTGTATLVFPFALVDPNTGTATTVTAYTFRYTSGLPLYLLAWPLGVCFYLGALGSATVGTLTNVEDRRVTAGLLVLAGLTHLSLAHGFSRQPGRFAIPVGTVLCALVVWWYDWPAIRSGVGLSQE